MTTTRVTHATPAAAYASSASRYWEAYVGDSHGSSCEDIASQLIQQSKDIQLISLKAANDTVLIVWHAGNCFLMLLYFTMV